MPSFFDRFFRRPIPLSEAVRLYFQHSPDLSKSRLRAIPLAARNWVRFGGEDDCRRITSASFVRVRAAAHSSGMAPATIETSLSVILSLLRHLGPRTSSIPHGLGMLREIPYQGKRLALSGIPKIAVPLESLAAVYDRVASADYAPKPVAPAIWWRAFLVLSYNTGLRISDLLALQWDQVDDEQRALVVVPSKTRRHIKRYALPINSTLQWHLDQLPRCGQRILTDETSADHLRITLAELIRVADVPHFTPQSIRRRAATEFERAHPGAGPLLLGHTVKSNSSISFDHYIGALETVLRPASEKIPQPWGKTE